MTDWSGRDYAEISGLQRAMATEAITALRFDGNDRVLDVGCGDGFLARAVAGMVPGGWDFGSRDAFARWCSVGSTAWTDRLPMQDRADFVGDVVCAYEPTVGRVGLFQFTQMRALLHR